jgi:hypothetical protein
MKVHNKITVKRAQKAKGDSVMLCIRCGRAQKPRSKGRGCYGCGEDMVHSADSILKMISDQSAGSGCARLEPGRGGFGGAVRKVVEILGGESPAF